MSKKMVTTQPGLFLFTDKDSAFQVTETGATVNGIPDPATGLMPCVRGEWIYTIEKGSCMDYHVTAKCSECGWDWFSKDGVGNGSAVFGAFITNGDSKRDEAERFLIENAKANNKLNYCPNCGAKMEDKPCE